jgi:hypothetical protein
MWGIFTDLFLMDERMINEKLIEKDLEGGSRDRMEVWNLLGVPPSYAYFLLRFLFDSEDGSN